MSFLLKLFFIVDSATPLVPLVGGASVTDICHLGGVALAANAVLSPPKADPEVSSIINTSLRENDQNYTILGGQFKE